MNKTLANIVIFLAMTAMMLPAVYSNVLQIQRLIAKMIAHEKLESEQLTTVRIAVSELVWYEEGRELIINNELFDVESFEIQNDTMIAKGLSDAKETAINSVVNKLMQSSGLDRVLQGIGYHILQLTAFQPTHFIFCSSPDPVQAPVTDNYTDKKLTPIYRPVQSPPPDYPYC
jgi:hypothetical protein